MGQLAATERMVDMEGQTQGVGAGVAEILVEMVVLVGLELLLSECTHPPPAPRACLLALTIVWRVLMQGSLVVILAMVPQAPTAP